ncbi:MAG: hypothetical protein GWO24_07975, partial [Akkermansiaceae bacterium]|nr:hypothetical protein [Akkermansiaceae bacterium]
EDDPGTPARVEAVAVPAARIETPAPPAPVEVDAGSQWLDLTNGGRLQLEVESWTAKEITGHHPILGRCVFPTELAHRLSLGAPAPEG